MTSRIVDNCPDKGLATTNYIYVSPNDILTKYQYVEIGSFIFKVGPHQNIPDGSVAMNGIQRKIARVSVRDTAEVMPYSPPPTLPRAALVYGEVAYAVDKMRPTEVQASEIIERMLKDFRDQIFTNGQQIVFEYQGGNYKLVISSIMVDDGTGTNKEVSRAFLRDNSAFVFVNGTNHPIKITGQKGFATTQLFKHKEINFQDLGIGGLDVQFEAIFRRAFASRVFPPSIVQKLGIQHVRGMLLYGPPGTGKTLIARQIGKMLNGKEPKVVNGPEILNKYVGASEENIRALFADAEADKAKGDETELHIIIFDEIDAICKSRGSVRDGSGVHDTVVNQLLTKIDGVEALNNILLIGMTNRKDMLDEALLRPGRLEVQIEIGLPDEKGRNQILKIHTNKMAVNSFLARDVDLFRLAEVTKNFSGAELEGLTKSAASFALNRQVDLADLHKPLDEDNIKVTMDDFEKALDEVKPAFGAQTELLDQYRTHGIISSGDTFEHLLQTLRTLVLQVKHSEKTPVLACLLEGPPGSGKSALAATIAMESDFPFVKVLSAEGMVGFSEQAKSSQITKVFEDAYKSPLSVVILDDIERLLEYVAIGPRFSNAILQTLLVLIKKQPPMGRKIFIVGTTSQGEVMESMGLGEVFNVNLHVPALKVDEMVRVLRAMSVFQPSDISEAVDNLTTICSKLIPIKKLMLWMEMAKQDLPPGTMIPLVRWQQVLRDLSS